MNRSQKSGSKQNKIKSCIRKVRKSSVPQGTILAPLLFLILIVDTDKNSNHVFVSFAGYTKIRMKVTLVEDRKIMNRYQQISSSGQMKTRCSMGTNFNCLGMGRRKNSDEHSTYTEHKQPILWNIRNNYVRSDI